MRGEETPSTHAASAGGQCARGATPQTPLAKYLPAGQKRARQEDYATQAPGKYASLGAQQEPSVLKGGKNAGSALFGGAPMPMDLGGQESLGTQHSTAGSHQAYGANSALAKRPMTGLRV